MLSLDSLSDAVILNIRDALGGDLAAHIALSQTCHRLRDVYRDNDPDAFWQFACYRAGFGRPRRRQAAGDGGGAGGPSWKDIALTLVNHALHCEIRTCRAANAFFAKSYNQATDIAILDRPCEGMQLHWLYGYLHFNPVPPYELMALEASELPDARSILYTVLPTYPESRQTQYGPLCSHPNACCAFITCPPVRSIKLYDAYRRPYLTVENPDGCTILDVNRGLAEILPNDEDFEKAAHAHYLTLHGETGLSLAQFVDSVVRVRGFLDDHEYPYLDLEKLLTVTA